MLIKKTLIIIILLLLGLFTPESVKAGSRQIYPNDFSVSNGVNSYWAGGSCWDGQTRWCYDNNPSQDTDRFVLESSDNISTFKVSGGAWFSSSKAYSCCQGNEWKMLYDSTRNHPTERVNFADQSIVIPAGVTKITRVKFYNITTDSTNNLVIALYPASSGEYPISGNIGAVPKSSQVTSLGGTAYAVDFQNILDWNVTAGSTYYIRFKNTNNDNLSIPVSSNCGAGGTNCKWWIDWAGSPTEKTTNDKAPHSQTDVYPQGKAYSGYRSGTGSITRSVYFNDIKGTGADLARMAVWGEITPPASPSSLSASCPAPGTLATVSWDPTARATSYNLRISDSSDAPAWNPTCSPTNPNDVCLDGLTGTSYTAANSQPGHNYGWWLHACNSSGCSASAGGPNFTCTPISTPTPTPTPIPVKLSTLTISNGLTSSITEGTAKTSGRTQEEKGSNWYNPMNISLTASGGIDPTTQYYVAFYDKKEGTGTVKTAYSSLDPIKQLLKNDPSAGFIFRYDVSGSKYYVWDWSATSGTGCIVNKGCFVDIRSQGYPIYNSAGVVLYWAYPKPLKPPSLANPTWQVKMMAAFGSKSMYTPGYVVNSPSSPVNKDFNPDMQPVVIPVSASLPASSSLAVTASIKQLIVFYFQQLLTLL